MWGTFKNRAGASEASNLQLIGAGPLSQQVCVSLEPARSSRETPQTRWVRALLIQIRSRAFGSKACTLPSSSNEDFLCSAGSDEVPASRTLLCCSLNTQNTFCHRLQTECPPNFLLSLWHQSLPRPSREDGWVTDPASPATGGPPVRALGSTSKPPYTLSPQFGL